MQHGAEGTAGQRHGARTRGRGDEAGPVGVREEHVVVLGEEAGRRRDVRVGPRRIGEVEELAAGAVPERHETRSQPLDHLADPRQAAPRRHVRDRCRAERAQVAQHDVVERRPFRERVAEPRLGCGRRHLRGAPPEPPRRHLDERQLAATRVRERGRIEVWEPLRECEAELAPGEWPLREELSGVVEDRPEIDALEGRGELRVPCELGVEHRLHQGPEGQAIAGRDEMDRRPHHRRAYDGAIRQELRERLRPEPVEARPEGDVGVAGHLGLEPDEALGRLERCQLRAPEQQLSSQRRPPEGARAEGPRGHAG